MVLSRGRMLYHLIELQRSMLAPVAESANLVRSWLGSTALPPVALARANLAVLHRTIRNYPRQPFGIRETTETVVATTPFCRLLHFERRAATQRPRVLVCAPLSGHHPTLIRDTIASLLEHHDVYLTDWLDARDVPVSAGTFSLTDYVVLVEKFIRDLGGRDLHVVAVCQPTVPVLVAVSRMAARGEPTPRSLTLMGGPIDARISPTQVDDLATQHSYAWFEKMMIHRVPPGFAGTGRAVYPGFLQLTAFVMMNPLRHAEALRDYWWAQLRGESGEAHEKFYDEYNAVLDMDASYYLDTIRLVFQEFALARGTWEIDGIRVDPSAIRETALFTLEGARDDISGLGQTAAAHALCTNIPEAMRRRRVDDVGHYGLFSGSHWRTQIYPAVQQFIAEHAS